MAAEVVREEMVVKMAAMVAADLMVLVKAAGCAVEEVMVLVEKAMAAEREAEMEAIVVAT